MLALELAEEAFDFGLDEVFGYDRLAAFLQHGLLKGRPLIAFVELKVLVRVLPPILPMRRQDRGQKHLFETADRLTLAFACEAVFRNVEGRAVGGRQ
jgi:hypothetical protein